jgi:hypothetical protein
VRCDDTPVQRPVITLADAVAGQHQVLGTVGTDRDARAVAGQSGAGQVDAPGRFARRQIRPG